MVGVTYTVFLLRAYCGYSTVIRFILVVEIFSYIENTKTL